VSVLGNIYFLLYCSDKDAILGDIQLLRRYNQLAFLKYISKLTYANKKVLIAELEANKTATFERLRGLTELLTFRTLLQLYISELTRDNKDFNNLKRLRD